MGNGSSTLIRSCRGAGAEAGHDSPSVVTLVTSQFANCAIYFVSAADYGRAEVSVGVKGQLFCRRLA